MEKSNRDLMIDLVDWGISAAGFAISSAVKSIFKLFGLPIASLVGVVSKIWDYKLEEERIAREYSREIAVKRGIPPGSVTVEDLEIVARENPALAEILRRNTLKRNIGIAVTLASTIIGFTLAYFFATPLAALFIGLHAAQAATLTSFIANAIAGGAIGLATYIVSKFSINEACGRIYELKEPYIWEVQHNPMLQDKLSLPSQIRYLERLQDRKQEIHEEQVMKVFARAHPELSPQEIRQRYSIEQITDDLNHRRTAPQELAFTVYGQQSGVPRAESPDDRAFTPQSPTLHERMAEKEEMVNAQLKHYSLAAMNNAGRFSKTVGTKAYNSWENSIMPKNIFDPAAMAAERLARGSAISPQSVRENQQKDAPPGITS